MTFNNKKYIPRIKLLLLVSRMKKRKSRECKGLNNLQTNGLTINVRLMEEIEQHGLPAHCDSDQLIRPSVIGTGPFTRSQHSLSMSIQQRDHNRYTRGVVSK